MKWVNVILLSVSMFLGLSCSSMSLVPISGDENPEHSAKSARDFNKHNWPLDVRGR